MRTGAMFALRSVNVCCPSARRRNEKFSAPTGKSGTPETPKTLATVPIAFNEGKSSPRLPANNRLDAPQQIAALSHLIVSRSVTTEDTLPAALLTVRTAHCVKTRTPAVRAARAMAGTASHGSAQPS